MNYFWKVFDPLDAQVTRTWLELAHRWNANPIVTKFNTFDVVMRLRRWSQENREAFARFAYVALPVLVFLANGQQPAHAYLFDTAQQSVEAAFPISTTVVAMAFNGGRAIFGLYLLVSIFKVLHSIRQEEDWQATAQTPAMVFIGVQLASLASTLIFP